MVSLGATTYIVGGELNRHACCKYHCASAYMKTNFMPCLNEDMQKYVWTMDNGEKKILA